MGTDTCMVPRAAEKPGLAQLGPNYFLEWKKKIRKTKKKKKMTERAKNKIKCEREVRSSRSHFANACQSSIGTERDSPGEGCGGVLPSLCRPRGWEKH